MPAPIQVELAPHSIEWATKAIDESGRIAVVLGSNLVSVHRVGSTAIPSICAKPILDLMPAALEYYRPAAGAKLQ